VDVEEVEREQGSGEGNVPKSHDSDNNPHPSQKEEGSGRAMNAICRGPRRLDSSGTSTVTDISTVLKVSQDSARTRICENIHVEGLQQRDRRGEARRVVLSINEKRRRAGDSGNAKAATEIGLSGMRSSVKRQ
jgi:hypothetical protein